MAATLASLSPPSLKKVLRAADVSPAEILACHNKSQLMQLAARYGINDIPDEWDLAKLNETRRAEAQEKSRNMTTLSGLSERTSVGKLTTPPPSRRGIGPSGARLRHELRAASAASSSSSPTAKSRAGVSARRAASARQPPELKDYTTRSRATRSPVTSRSMQEMINQAHQELEEKRKFEGKKRRIARARAKRMAREAEEDPLPTRTPDYPDWKVAPPHVLANNYAIREENRIAAERQMRAREREIDKMRKAYLKAATRASGTGSAVAVALYGFDPDDSVDGSDAGSWSGDGNYGGSNAGGAPQLAIEAGESLTVFDDNGWGTVPKGWILARNDRGEQGLVPLSFLEAEMPHEHPAPFRSEWTERLRPKSVRSQGPGPAVTRNRYQSARAAEEQRRREEEEAKKAEKGVWGWLW